VDGDNLTGFHKRGVRVGLSLFTRLQNSVFGGIGLSYQSLGSSREEVLQRRPNERSEVEVNLSSIAVSPRIRIILSKVTTLELELPLHAIFKADTKFINNRVNVAQFEIKADQLRSVSWSFVVNLSFSLSDNLALQVGFERFMQNLLQVEQPIDNIRVLQPFYCTVGLTYNLISFSQKKTSRRQRVSR
jgi:hypothetical protein